MRTNKFWRASALAGIAILCCLPTLVTGQNRSPQQYPSPLLGAIEKQRLRLTASEMEERRDALLKLGSMHHPAASRAALSALNDPLPIIRVTAASAVLSLPAEEGTINLLPLLNDKDEFVRREAAYALGRTRSRTAVSRLSELLLTDKEDGVRGAAAVALGQIGDAAAVVPLSSVIDPQMSAPTTKKKKKSKREQNPFVVRSAARALGQIGNRAGVPALLVLLRDEKSEDDLRRESAAALGMIGDASAVPSLQDALTSRDPYLAEAARQAIKRITRTSSR